MRLVHKVGSVDMFVLSNFENMTDSPHQLKYHEKSTIAFKLIRLFTGSNIYYLFTSEVVQNTNHVNYGKIDSFVCCDKIDSKSLFKFQ